jgi:hypothetical protein
MMQRDHFHTFEAPGNLLRAPVGSETGLNDELNFRGKLESFWLVFMTLTGLTICLLMPSVSM